eukprot:CAMPEP_0197603600 /NCGR_PEP_ID=MMETSP1326-20131121/39539_1 /TAXON_ID=1155430 /ORGANISM="Genus nov. species nov., Strain RCC2288" /LENGTH=114 /DNA_ID=CAMNT_0043171127 /DNA_START=288 /DNA_END=629 /DNA_ORIENTATION=-
MGAPRSKCSDEDREREEGELVEVLELSEELIRLKLALGQRMKDGYMSIAVARFTMGGGDRISQWQYDLNMRAQARVTCTSEGRSEEEHATSTTSTGSGTGSGKAAGGGEGGGGG